MHLTVHADHRFVLDYLEPPGGGRIAVKIVDDRGIESLKVMMLGAN